MPKYRGFTIIKDHKGGWTTVEDPQTRGATLAHVKRVIDSGNTGSDPRAFVVSAWRFFKTEYLASAPDEIMELFDTSGLRPPEEHDDNDFMAIVFTVIAKRLPPRLLSPDILAEKNDEATRTSRALLLCLFCHPKWRQVRMLEALAEDEKMTSLRTKKSEDWRHWVFLFFRVIELLMLRMFGDIKTVIDGERSPTSNVINLVMERNLKNGANSEKSMLPDGVIATDDELLKAVTESYRETLFEWNITTMIALHLRNMIFGWLSSTRASRRTGFPRLQY
jgi:hypothetical protein